MTARSAPYWLRTPFPRFRRLDRNLNVDVAVVGAGITGITTALLLKRAGHRVALIERDRCATRDTGHTTAHLTSVLDTRLTRLARSYGSERARLAWEAGQAAIEQIASLVEELGIDCEFRRVPFYLCTPLRDREVKAADRKRLIREVELARELGFPAEFVPEIPVTGRPGLRMPNQALFHPRKYLRSLVERIPGGGSHVFEHTAVEEITEEPLAVRAGGYRIACGHVVLATNTPLEGKATTLRALLFQTKLALYSSYVVGARIRPGRVPQAYYFDLDDPYYYLRVEPGRRFDYAIFGGEDHKTGQQRDTRACYRALERQLRRLIPGAQVVDRWSGQLIETHDGLPYIGEHAERQFAATGYCGNGMTLATVAALMCRDWMGGYDNPWQELFSPRRKNLKAGALAYLRENVDYPVHLVADRLERLKLPGPRSVRRGEGRIVRYQGKNVAAYRDDSGRLTLLSQVCPHLGCLVNWNAAEKTWDCPCHGSRFRPDGSILGGPAEEPLAPIAN